MPPIERVVLQGMLLGGLQGVLLKTFDLTLGAFGAAEISPPGQQDVVRPLLIGSLFDAASLWEPSGEGVPLQPTRGEVACPDMHDA